MSPALQGRQDVVEHCIASLAGLPFRLAAQQVFFGDHLQDRADVLRHAAVHEHQAVLQLAARLGRDVASVEDAMRRAAGGRG